MEEFEKKYCFKRHCFDVDKNIKEEHLDKINSNRNIRVISVSGGMQSPAHIIFNIGKQNDLSKAETYLKKTIPNSKVECFGWARGGYALDHQNKDYRGKTRTPSTKTCSVTSRKQKSSAWWKKASKVIGGLR